MAALQQTGSVVLIEPSSHIGASSTDPMHQGATPVAGDSMSRAARSLGRSASIVDVDEAREKAGQEDKAGKGGKAGKRDKDSDK